MVGRFGMSEEIGFLSVLPQDGQATPATPRSPSGRGSASTTRCEGSLPTPTRRPSQLLSENRDRLDSLAEALYKAETLEGPEAYAAAGLDVTDRPDVVPRSQRLRDYLTRRSELPRPARSAPGRFAS